jgi:hypothetical protein
MKHGYFKQGQSRSIHLLLLLLAVFSTSSQQQVNAQTGTQSTTAPVVESGKFRIYELKQVQGEETYEIRRESGGLMVNAKLDLPFQGEDLKPSLNAVLRMKDDLTPEQFEIKGVRASELKIDTSISIEGKTARVRESNEAAEAGRPTMWVKQIALGPDFFTFGGYLPVTMEAMLVRYWLKHNFKGPLKLLPAGEAFLEHRGQDTVTVNGKPTVLDRYHLSGSNWGGGWGPQTLWFDSELRLVAAVNLGTDIETNLYAIRDGYDSALSFFLQRTVADGIDRWTQVADRLSPRSKSPLVLVGGTLIDSTGKPPIANSAVVIQGDRIVAAGPRRGIKIPEGATVVDVSGKFLLPGLWDMHAHLYQLELGPAYLAAGITSARDVGNEFEFGTVHGCFWPAILTEKMKSILSTFRSIRRQTRAPRCSVTRMRATNRLRSETMSS